MSALRKQRGVEGLDQALILAETITGLVRKYVIAWKRGGEHRAKCERIFADIAALVPIGHYECYVDFDSLELVKEISEVSVLGVGKDEITHDFFVIVLRHGAVHRQVPIDHFALLSEGITFKRAVKPAELMQEHLSQLTEHGQAGYCQHVTSTEDNPRGYLALGSILDPVNGAVVQLYHEDRQPFDRGLRLRPVHGNRGFSTHVYRERRQVPRFHVASLPPPELIKAVQARS